ncbi:MAG: hypothetical protein Q7R93_02415 [bacterium]|nr:hypothetical protein [bacterium]
MNKKQGLAPGAAIVLLALLIIAGGYSLIAQKGKSDTTKEPAGSGIDMIGIDPFSLAGAPVPSLNGEYNGVSTTSPSTDENGDILRFSNYHFDFSKGIIGCGSPGAFDDLGVLGYALMGGVPTAVTIVNERVCGTGYFPHVVLYQAKGEYAQPTIVDVMGIIGDRIEIHYLNIRPDHISLTYTSWGEEKSTTVNLEYLGGRLVKK